MASLTFPTMAIELSIPVAWSTGCVPSKVNERGPPPLFGSPTTLDSPILSSDSESVAAEWVHMGHMSGDPPSLLLPYMYIRF